MTPFHSSSLEIALLQYGVRECVVEVATKDINSLHRPSKKAKIVSTKLTDQLESFLNRQNIKITYCSSSKVAPSKKDTGNVLESLCALSGLTKLQRSKECIQKPEMDLNEIAQMDEGLLAADNLMDHLNLPGDGCHKYHIVAGQIGRFMQLDLSCTRALSVFHNDSTKEQAPEVVDSHSIAQGETSWRDAGVDDVDGDIEVSRIFRNPPPVPRS